MSVSIVEHSTVAQFSPISARPPIMSRPQIGIERLPTRRLSTEPRESMNCKSCRKRKIKCNRLRPACEACQVFQCACIYDAVPKKRGPKTDVLEALLKRVDGLEQQLKDQKKEGSSTEPGAENNEPRSAGTTWSVSSSGGISGNSPDSENSATAQTQKPTPTSAGESAAAVSAGGPSNPVADATASEAMKQARQLKKQPQQKNREKKHVPDESNSAGKPTIYVAEPLYASPPSPPETSPPVQTSALLHTYFTRFHAKPFHILDEASFRQRLQVNQIPSYLLGAVCALAARYTLHPNGFHAAVSMGDEFARKARLEVDADEPSLDCLQTLLLLSLAFVASGKGKKSYMLLSNAIGMAVALELHREMDASVQMAPVEREMRRRLFWTCYLLDRFMACGSRRPSLINDSTVFLRLPCWATGPSVVPIEGDFFQSATNVQYLQGGGGRKLQGSGGLLIDIGRILGVTNRYLAAGGVKGDSHFPWHSLSNLSKIRQDLDVWASGAQDLFSSVETLFAQPDATVLVMSKLIYHLIHCLIYRPFLPVDLAELSGTGQHRSWQIEATNLCFLHANAIAELTELGRQMPQIEWPGFVGYCISTAGTVHVHGAHYQKNGNNGDISVFAASAEFLAREMQQLTELRYSWACVQHHRNMLQSIYDAHTELVKNVAENPMRYFPVFQLDDFFDRYTNIGGPGDLSFRFDSSNLILADVVVDFLPDPAPTGSGTYPFQMDIDLGGTGARSTTAAGGGRQKRFPSLSLSNDANNGNDSGNHEENNTMASLQSPSHAQQQSPFSATFSSISASQMMPSPTGGNLSPRLSHPGTLGDNEAQPSIAEVAGFSLASQPQQQQQQQQQQQTHGIASGAPFSPAFNLASLTGGATPAVGSMQGGDGPRSGAHTGSGIDMSGYDPMFGTLPTNAFTSPVPWSGVDDPSNGNGGNAGGGGMVVQHSPDGGRSNDGSSMTGGTLGGEEKDPFLSLLEQLAENEYARGPGNELDFFLTGAAGSV